MDSIEHNFASQFGADSDNVNTRITTPDFIESINLKTIKQSKPNQRHPLFADLQPPSILKPIKQTTSNITLENNYQIKNIKTNPEEHDKNLVSDEQSECHATQRVPTEKSNVVNKEEDINDNTLECDMPGRKEESIEDMAERMETEIENEFLSVFTSEETTDNAIERIEKELDFEFAEYELSLQSFDEKCVDFELAAVDLELAAEEEDSKMSELNGDLLIAEQKYSVILELKELFAATTNIPTNLPTNLPTKNPSSTPTDNPSITFTINIIEAKAHAKNSNTIKNVPTITPITIPTNGPTGIQFTLPVNLPSTKVKYDELPYPFDIPADPTDPSTSKIYDWYQIKSAKKKPPKITPPKQPPPDRDKIGIVPDFRGWIGDFEGANGTRMSRERVC